MSERVVLVELEMVDGRRLTWTCSKRTAYWLDRCFWLLLGGVVLGWLL